MSVRPSIVLATLVTPAMALAHPGHGTTEGHSLLHQLVDHPLTWIALAAAAALGAYGWHRARR